MIVRKFLRTLWKAEKSVFIYWLAVIAAQIAVYAHRKEFDSISHIGVAELIVLAIGYVVWRYSFKVYRTNR